MAGRSYPSYIGDITPELDAVLAGRDLGQIVAWLRAHANSTRAMPTLNAGRRPMARHYVNTATPPKTGGELAALLAGDPAAIAAWMKITPEEARSFQQSLREGLGASGEGDRHVQEEVQRALAQMLRDGDVPGRPNLSPAGGAAALGGLKAKDRLVKNQSVVGWLEANGQAKPADRELSLGSYLKGLATGKWDNAERERQLYLNSMSEGVSTAGGHLVPTPLAGYVIDLARNASRVFQAGAVTVPMTAATLKVPRLTGEGTPGWRSENAAISAADLAFDAVTFTARSLNRLVTLSVELFEDADPSAGDVIARSFAAQIALEIDRAALRGTGSAPEPRGVLNQSGVTLTSHGANGSTIGSPPSAGVMGWEFLAQAAGAVRSSNFEPTGQILAPRTSLSLALLRDTTNQYIAPPTYLDGVTRLQTKQVPINLTVGTSADCSEVYTGQWDQLMIGVRTEFRIQVLTERYADNGQYAFLAWFRGDVQLAQPAAFVVDTGVRS